MHILSKSNNYIIENRKRSCCETAQVKGPLGVFLERSGQVKRRVPSIGEGWLLDWFAWRLESAEGNYLEASFQRLVVLLVETLSYGVVGGHNDLVWANAVEMCTLDFCSERVVIAPNLEVVRHVLAA